MRKNESISIGDCEWQNYQHYKKSKLSGITGLGLVGFVIAHLTGNFLILKVQMH